MPSPFINEDGQINRFESLGQDSPQIKPQNSNEENQEETSSTIKEQLPRKIRSKKLKERQTNLIKIRPVQNQQQLETNFKQINRSQNEDEFILQNDSEPQYVNVNQQEMSNESIEKMESPVVFKFQDDDEEIEMKQQTIPQSSRRPFRDEAESATKIDSDQLQSPKKLLKSLRKERSKKFQLGQNGKRFIKMKKNTQYSSKREPTQVYEYEFDNQNNNENDESEESQAYYDEQDTQQNIKQNQCKINTFLEKSVSESIQKADVVVLKSNNFYTLINAQIPKNSFVNCLIKRKRSGSLFDKMVTYEFYLLQDKKYLMTCVKNRILNTTSHFQFFKEKSLSHNYHKQNLYAYLDSNFTGTEFVLKTIAKNDTISQRSTAIDKSELSKLNQSTSSILESQKKGLDLFPNETKTSKNYQNEQTLHQKQNCFISFKANLFGLAGQRQVKLLKKKNKKITKTGKFSDIKQAQINGQFDKFQEFSSKKAIFGKNGLQLDFKKIAKVQSTKNIMIEDKNSKEVLIFGKIKQDIYSIVIGSPFSIMEGLAFGIANLDRKFFVN